MINSVFLFFSFSGSEIMLILFVALILFGGDKFPEIARGLGKGIREFKDMSDGVKREIHSQINNYDLDPTRPSTNNTTTTTPPVIAPVDEHQLADTHETPAVPFEAQVAAHETFDPNLPPQGATPAAVPPTPHQQPVEVAPEHDPNRPPNTISHQSY